MKIWVTGAAGMLGQDLARALAAGGVEVVGTDREVDITSQKAVTRFGNRNGPFRWIVNCAAFTAVDEAEECVSVAERLNVIGPGVLSEAARETDAAILHLSTDYVFDGRGEHPYPVDAPTSPANVYGRTKRDGENTVRSTAAHHVILRTAWLYGAGGNSFVKTMLRLMNERNSIRVVSDQRGAPTWTRDLATAILRIVTTDESRQTVLYGTYHYTGAGETTWYGFAKEIYQVGRKLGLVRRECLIESITTAEYPTPAARPAYSVLSLKEIERDYGIIPPRWQESLHRYMQEETAQ